MRRRMLTLTVGIAVLAMAGAALAQPRGQGRGKRFGKGTDRGHGMGMMMLGRCVLASPELGLTDEQSGTIRDIQKTAWSDMAGLKDEMKGLRDAFIEAFADPDISDTQLKQMSDSIHEHMRNLKDRRFGDFLKIRHVLTPEQLAKTPAIVKECRNNGRRGCRGGQCGPPDRF